MGRAVASRMRSSRRQPAGEPGPPHRASVSETCSESFRAAAGAAPPLASGALPWTARPPILFPGRHAAERDPFQTRACACASRHPACRPAPAEKPGILGCRRAGPGARHWRQYRGLQPGQRPHAPADGRRRRGHRRHLQPRDDAAGPVSRLFLGGSEQIRANRAPFDAVMAYTVTMIGAQDGDTTRRSFSAIASAGYFSTLGVQARRGTRVHA